VRFTVTAAVFAIRAIVPARASSPQHAGCIIFALQAAQQVYEDGRTKE
jgi:hypothetical protein